MTIKYRLQDIRRLRDDLGADGDKVETARRWAVNAVARKAATAISRDIRDDYAIRAADIKAALQIRTFEDTGKALLYTGGKIPLERFAGKDKRVKTTATSKRGKQFKTSRRAATARVRKSRGRQVVRPGGFLAKGRIFRRREQGRNDSQIVPVFGPSIPGMVAYPETIRRASDLVERELPQQFSDRLDYLLNRK